MHRLIAIFLIICVTGCATFGTVLDTRKSDTATSDKNITIPEKTLKQIQRLLAEANRSTNPEATESRIQAAQLATKYNQMSLLRIILDAIATPFINKFTSRDYSLLQARLALADRDPVLALSLLDHARFQRTRLDSNLLIQVGRIRAGAWLFRNDHLASARELIAINALLLDQERSANQEVILIRLLQLPLEILTRQAKQSSASDLRGWLSLASIMRRYQDNPEQQFATLYTWRKAWTGHAAVTMITETLEQLTRLIEQRPGNIALILPLQDEEIGIYGRAIRDGFIAAYYYQKSQTPGFDSTLSIFDSSKADIIDILARAKAGGAEIIIGPLKRDKITRLAKQTLQIPVMALNRTEQKIKQRNFYQFSLAPEDESVQLAEKIYDAGLLQGLVIAPDTDWGQRNVDAFSDRFLSLGGRIIDSARFQSQRDYSDLVKSLLNINASEARAQTLRQATNQSFQFKARRRQDIDFVFLLANHAQAKGINPTLAYFYADDVPVYSTSHVHDPSASRIDVIDLKGIRFCDIPWKLTRTDPVQIVIQKTWPAASTRLARFYALGLDAYRLYPRLQLPGASTHIFGSTGLLNLSSDNVVQRTLIWAEFKDGGVQVVPRYEAK